MAAEDAHPAGFAPYAAEPSPAVPVGSPGKDGHLLARFERTADDRTRLVRDRARVPYHLGRQLRYDDPFAAIRIQSPTAGVGAGDRLSMELSAGPDALAHVSTASATKVFRMDHDYGRETVELRAEHGGYLEYLPEPTIVYADARFQQEVDLHVEADATVLFADTFVPGRLARQEAFEFDRYAQRVTGHTPDGLAFADAMDLGNDPDVSGPGVLGPHAVVGSLYALTPGTDASALSDHLHDRVTGAVEELEPENGSAPQESPSPPVEASASVLPRESGVVVRVLGPSPRPVTSVLAAARDAVRRQLVGVVAPDPRRW